MSGEHLCEIEFAESPIPDGTLRRLDEVTIKRDGCIWRIHKNDVDPFPSSPHAHNVESGLKLDLTNGALYWGTQPTGKSITKKEKLTGGNLTDVNGQKVCPNGVRVRQDDDGPRIYIPANGIKPPEAIHFPEGTPWLWSK